MKIDLGTERSNNPCGCIGGESEDEKDEKKIEYPCLYVYDAPSDLLKIAKEGKAVIEFRVKSRSERENYDGEDENSIDLEIRSITPVSESEAKESKTELEAISAFDEYMKSRNK